MAMAQAIPAATTPTTPQKISTITIPISTWLAILLIQLYILSTCFEPSIKMVIRFRSQSSETTTILVHFKCQK